ncbi:hypothetical protein DFJ74DRAFT_697944 [Hyaloraphidium curvatum]|nr:hypothetical protein DFJ74DRAFT_697944 [Hyaloraphidium curvatum]
MWLLTTQKRLFRHFVVLALGIGSGSSRRGYPDLLPLVQLPLPLAALAVRVLLGARPVPHLLAEIARPLEAVGLLQRLAGVARGGDLVHGFAEIGARSEQLARLHGVDLDLPQAVVGVQQVLMIAHLLELRLRQVLVRLGRHLLDGVNGCVEQRKERGGRVGVLEGHGLGGPALDEQLELGVAPDGAGCRFPVASAAYSGRLLNLHADDAGLEGNVEGREAMLRDPHVERVAPQLPRCPVDVDVLRLGPIRQGNVDLVALFDLPLLASLRNDGQLKSRAGGPLADAFGIRQVVVVIAVVRLGLGRFGLRSPQRDLLCLGLWRRLRCRVRNLDRVPDRAELLGNVIGRQEIVVRCRGMPTVGIRARSGSPFGVRGRRNVVTRSRVAGGAPLDYSERRLALGGGRPSRIRGEARNERRRFPLGEQGSVLKRRAARDSEEGEEVEHDLKTARHNFFVLRFVPFGVALFGLCPTAHELAGDLHLGMVDKGNKIEETVSCVVGGRGRQGEAQMRDHLLDRRGEVRREGSQQEGLDRVRRLPLVRHVERTAAYHARLPPRRSVRFGTFG